MKPIVVIGSINLDTVYRVKWIPSGGETIMAKSVNRYAGGKGANQAVAAARMGADVTMIGRVGKDEQGEFMLNSLSENSAKVAGVVTDANTSTGTAFIMVSDDGENTIVVNSGANGQVDENQIDLFEKLIKGAEYCVFQLEIPVDTVFYGISKCHKLGVKTVLNPSPSMSVPSEVLKRVSVLIVNKDEYERVAGQDKDPVEFVRESGVGEVIITLGSKGLKRITADGVTDYPCMPVKAVDTTGAGDCFLGAYMAMLCGGYGADESIRAAMKAAAIAVSRPGAQRSMPYLREVID